MQRLNARVPSLCSGRREGSGLRSQRAGWGFPLDGEWAKVCWGRSLLGATFSAVLGSSAPATSMLSTPKRAIRCESVCSFVSACVCVVGGEGLLLSQTLLWPSA